MKEKVVAISNVWRAEVKEISYEEFPFENFNNMTFGNGLILLKRILLGKL